MNDAGDWTPVDLPDASDTPLHADYRAWAQKYGGRITSVDRTPQHNADVGGVSNSQHIALPGEHGTAMDVVFPANQRGPALAEAHSRGWMGLDEGTHVHVQLSHGGGSGGTPVSDWTPVDPPHASASSEWTPVDLPAAKSAAITPEQVGASAKELGTKVIDAIKAPHVTPYSDAAHVAASPASAISPTWAMKTGQPASVSDLPPSPVADAVAGGVGENLTKAAAGLLRLGGAGVAAYQEMTPGMRDANSGDLLFSASDKANAVAESLGKQATALSPTGEKTGNVLGTLGTFLAAPEADIEALGPTVSNWLARMTSNPTTQAFLAQSAKSAAANLPRAAATAALPNTAQSSALQQEGVSPGTVAALETAGDIGGTLQGVLPVSAPLGPLGRIAAGLVTQQTVQKGQQAIQHAIAPDKIAAPGLAPDLSDPATYLGPLMGLLGGKGGSDAMSALSDEQLHATAKAPNTPLPLKTAAVMELAHRGDTSLAPKSEGYVSPNPPAHTETVSVEPHTPFVAAVNERTQPIAPEDTGSALMLHDTVRAALESGVHPSAVLPAEHESDAEHYARLFGTMEAAHGTDTAPATGDHGGGNPPLAPERGSEVPASGDAAPRTEPTASPGEPGSTAPRNPIAASDANRILWNPADPYNIRLEGRTNAQITADALAKYRADPAIADRIINQFAADGRPLTAEETQILSHHVESLTNSLDVAKIDHSEAMKEGDQNKIASAAANHEVIDQNLKNARMVQDIGGNVASRAFGVRDFATDGQRFSDSAVFQRAKALRDAAGPLRDLTPEEQQILAGMAAKVRAKTVELQKAEAVEKTKADRHEEGVARTLKKQLKVITAESAKPGSLAEGIHRRASEARERLKAAQSVTNKMGQSGAVMNPAHLIDLAHIGAEHILNGALKFTDWVVRMKAELGEGFHALMPGKDDPKTVYDESRKIIAARKSVPQTPQERAKATTVGELTHKDVADVVRAHILAGTHGEDPLMAATHKTLTDQGHKVTERDVRRMYSQYGEAKFPSQDAVKKEMRETRAIVQTQESIDRLKQGLDPLRSGPQRDKATQAMRAKRQQLDDMLKQQIDKTSPASPEKLATYQEMRRNSLQHQIDDIGKEIETNQRRAKVAPPELDAKNKQLLALRDQYAKARDEMDFALNPKDSDAKERVRLQRQIDDITKPKHGVEPKPKRADSIETAKLRDRLQAMRDARDAFEREPPKNTEEKRIAALEKQLKDIQEGKQKLPPEHRAETPQEAALKEQIRQAKMGTSGVAPTRPLDPNEAVTTRLKKQIADLQDRLAKGDFEPRKRAEPRPLNDANWKLRDERNKLAEQVEAKIREIGERGQGPVTKFGRLIANVGRFNKFTSPLIFVKLGAMAMNRTVITPLEHMASSVLRHVPVVGGIMKNAPKFGSGFVPAAEWAALKQQFSKQSLQDTLLLPLTHSDSISREFGHRDHPMPSSLSEKVMATPGDIHAAIKVNIKHNAVGRALVTLDRYYRGKFAAEGMSEAQVDEKMQSEQVKADIKQRVGELAQEAVSQHTTRFSNWWAGMIAQGRNLGGTHAVGANLLDSAFPVVKIAMNLASEGGSFAAGAARAAPLILKAMRHGPQSLTEAESETVARNMRKNALGVVGLTAYLYAQSQKAAQMGTYYQQGDSKRKNIVPEESLKVGDTQLWKGVTEHPMFTPIKLAATIQRIYSEDHKSYKPAVRDNAAESAGLAAVKGYLKSIPFADTISQLTDINSSAALNRYLGNQAAGMAIPAAVSRYASANDPVNASEHPNMSAIERFFGGINQSDTRKAQTALEAFKTHLPGYREEVHTKDGR